MKIAIKIFLSIFICCSISVLLISEVIINKEYSLNINRENERCLEEFSLILYNIENNIVNTKIEEQSAVRTYGDYYKTKGITFTYIKLGKVTYTTIPELIIKENDEVLSSTNKNYVTKIQDVNGEKYILISTVMPYAGGRLIYSRNVSDIYNIKEKVEIFRYIMIGSLLIILLIVSYVIAKSITRPLEKIKQNTLNISKGDFSIKLEETNDEIGQLSKLFNKMSNDIHNRNDELIELAENKQLFIDNLSHEMNTPLTTIQGYAELLEKANCDEEQKIKFLQYIQEESKRIRDMYKKLLLISYKKRSELEIKEEDFKEILEDIKRNLENRFQDAKIVLVIDNKIDKLDCDKTLLEIAISNLIINAINVSKEGDKIIVNAYETENEKIIEVIDEGVGISQENIEKITDPFYRVDKARSRKLRRSRTRTFYLQKHC